MRPAGRFVVPHGHPSLPGHFPGRPVVPGVLLLDEVLRLLAPCVSGAVTGVASAKFLRPVLPGEEVAVSVDPATGGFECVSPGAGSGGTDAGRTVLRGRVLVAPR